MRLLINLDTDNPTVISAPCKGDIVSAFSPDELWYGAEIALQSDDEFGCGLFATSVCNGFARPSDPGEFMLSYELQGNVTPIAGEFTRSQVVEYFTRALNGQWPA
jgi:hypothetical protein